MDVWSVLFGVYNNFYHTFVCIAINTTVHRIFVVKMLCVPSLVVMCFMFNQSRVICKNWNSVFSNSKVWFLAFMDCIILISDRHQMLSSIPETPLSQGIETSQPLAISLPGKPGNLHGFSQWIISPVGVLNYLPLLW